MVTPMSAVAVVPTESVTVQRNTAERGSSGTSPVALKVVAAVAGLVIVMLSSTIVVHAYEYGAVPPVADAVAVFVVKLKLVPDL
jgi:hypothetical protein